MTEIEKSQREFMDSIDEPYTTRTFVGAIIVVFLVVSAAFYFAG